MDYDIDRSRPEDEMDKEPDWIDCACHSEGWDHDEVKPDIDGKVFCAQGMAEHFGFGSAGEMSRWLVGER